MPLSDVCDSVKYTELSGTVRSLTVAEYEQLPLKDRVAALLAKRLKYYSKGKEVAASDVVAAMNR